MNVHIYRARQQTDFQSFLPADRRCGTRHFTVKTIYILFFLNSSLFPCRVIITVRGTTIKQIQFNLLLPWNDGGGFLEPRGCSLINRRAAAFTTVTARFPSDTISVAWSGDGGRYAKVKLKKNTKLGGRIYLQNQRSVPCKGGHKVDYRVTRAEITFPQEWHFFVAFTYTYNVNCQLLVLVLLFLILYKWLK